MSAPAGGVDPLFARERRDLEAFAPHVIVVFDVDAVAPELYRGLGAAVLGVAAPDGEGFDPPPPPTVPRARLRARLWRRLQRPALSAAALDEPWDRLVALDPAAARGRPLWRLIAPPVDDALFAPPRRSEPRARVTFAAASTAYRERLLLDAKHRHDLRHVAHGLTPAALVDGIDVAVVVQPREDAGFQHALALHAAAGHLVICDHTGHGLEAGTDVLLATDPRALAHAVGAVRTAPDVHHSVRVRGRLKAERFRASRVWPALAADLQADLDAFG